MTLQNFLVIDKISGIPVYIKNFGENNKKESTQDVLFSGMMSAIRTLMMEMKLGNLKSISTEKFDIFGKEGKQFSFFLIGILEINTFLQETFDEIVKYIDYLPMDDSNLRELPPDITQYLDNQTEFLYKIYMRSNYISSVFKYSHKNGLQSLKTKSNEFVDIYLANYFHNLNKKNYEKNHYFMDKLYDESYILGVSFFNREDYSCSVLILNFKSANIIDLMAYKHHFITLSFNLIDQYHDRLFSITENVSVKESILDEFSSSLENVMKHHVITLDLEKLSYVYELIDDMMPEIISTAIIGHPIAFVGEQESVKFIIDLLVHITSLLDVGLEPDPNLPKRFTWCPPEFLDMFKKIGYSIVNLDDKNINMVTLPYYTELHQEIKDFHPTDAITMYKEVTNEIIQTVEHILTKLGKGAMIKLMLDELPDNMQAIIYKIFDWSDPYLITDSVREIKSTDIYW